MTIATTPLTPPETTFQVEPLVIAGRTFRSRLFLGTGKYPDFATMEAALEDSGTEMVTVALRRVNLDDRGKGSLLDFVDPERYLLLPNTAGCYTADEAVRTARLARELGGWDWVKLEVIGDRQDPLPRQRRAPARPPRCWSPRASSSCPTPTTTRSICRKLEEAWAPRR